MHHLNKPKSLRKKLILSYVLLILIVGSLFSSIYFISSLRETKVQTGVAVNSVKRLADANYKHQIENLQPLIKQYIRHYVETTAEKLATALSKKDIQNLKYLKNDKNIRKVATQSIKTHDVVVGYMAMLNKEGTVIFHPVEKFEGMNIESLKDKNQQLYKLYNCAIRTNELTGFGVFNKDRNDLGREYKYLVFVHVPKTEYYLYATITLNKFLDPIAKKIKLQEDAEIGILNKQINKEFFQTWFAITSIFLLALFILCLVGIIIGLWLSGIISRPIRMLRNAAIKMGEGDFKIEVEENGSEETVQLAKTFNELGHRLSQYMADLKKEVIARQKIKSELDIARKIQRSILPQASENFIRPEFSIVAELVSAEEVAGDFFDFFYIDKERKKLAIIIGDVSGKGVPAAFFMGILKTVAKNICKRKPDDLATAAYLINNFACSDNSEKMFATMFILYYDIPSGELKYVNAGHHEALVVNSQSGKTRSFGASGNTLVGFFENVKYVDGTDKLNPGEILVLYTDGITEAFGKSDECYGEKRLLELITTACARPVKELTQCIVDDVTQFQDNVLFDDMTLVVFKRN